MVQRVLSNRLHILMLIVIVLFIGSSLNAQQMKSHIALTDDFSFSNKWYKIPSGSIPIIRGINKIYKFQTFYILIYLGGFQVDNKNMPQVSYSVKALTPNGSQYFSYDSINAISYEVPNPNIFLMSNSTLGISFEEEDLKGTYIISGIITDNLSKETIRFEKKIKFVEFIEKEAFTNDSLFGDWLQNYFKSPKPEHALKQFEKFVSNKNDRVNDSLSYSFFIELFRTNNFLLKYLINEFNEYPKRVQNEILKMYVYTNIEDDFFLNSLDHKQRKKIKSLRKGLNPYTIDSVSRPKHLDMLWAKFFANGSFEPIQKIVNTLTYGSYIGSLEKFGPVDNMSKLNEDCWKELVFEAAAWSLSSNIKSYSLVRNYCHFIYLDAETSDIVKQILSIYLTDSKNSEH